MSVCIRVHPWQKIGFRYIEKGIMVPQKILSRFTFIVLAALALLAACVGPQGKSQDSATYLLNVSLPIKSSNSKSPHTILVAPMRAHPGFDTPRMAYQREPNRIDYYAYNRWVEAPARMLTPLVTQALEANQSFAAVVQAPGAAHTQLRLETELVSLTQDFSTKPSRMRLVLRAQLVDTQTQSIRGSRSFETQAPAGSEDARGGADAVNRALPEMLGRLAEWVAQASANRP